MSGNERVQALGTWLYERVPLHKLNFEDMLKKKEVPVHRMSWAYYLGGLALLFFGIQVVTGLMLLFYYQPTVADARRRWSSSRSTSAAARSSATCTWSSSGMILCVLAHCSRPSP